MARSFEKSGKKVKNKMVIGFKEKLAVCCCFCEGLSGFLYYL